METLGNAKVYRRLNLQIREIRVVEILPRDTSHEDTQNGLKMALELKYYSLDDDISYEALSYTWGDPKKTAIIKVDSNENFVVRQSLESALRDLRLPTERRVIWIDALCINQADFEERSEQVKLMRSIYANATIVRSWLNQEIDPSNAAFVRLQSLSEDSSNEVLGEDAEFWVPLGEVFANEYWYRIWVQQEIAYAAQWTVQCRICEIPSKCLMRFATLMVMKLWGFYTDPLLDKTKWKTLMPTPLRPLLYRSRRDDGEVSASTFYGPLNRALKECRDLKSTDPKDKVFAMLGMIDDYHDGDIDVDYNLSDKQVYVNIVRLFIDRYSSLDFLREATLGNLMPGHERFPSWLPDWSQTSSMDPFTSPSVSIINSRENPSTFSPPPAKICQGLLQVRGFRIGSVASLLPGVQQERLWTGKLEIISLVAKFRSFQGLIDNIDTLMPTEPSSLKEYRAEYLFRALTGADARGTEQIRTKTYLEIFNNLLSASRIERDDEACAAFVAVIGSDATHFGDLVHYMQQGCRGRYFFLTTEHCMGLIPVQASLDDEIWYIVGCTIPMTLRRGESEHMVVGEAYVNDHMGWRSVDNVLETPGGMPLTGYQIQDITMS